MGTITIYYTDSICVSVLSLKKSVLQGRASQLGVILSPGDTWQCPETFLVVTTGERSGGAGIY